MDQTIGTLQPGIPAGKSKNRAGAQAGEEARFEMQMFLQVNLIVFYYLVVMLAAFWLFLDTWGGNLVALSYLGLSQQASKDPLLPGMIFLITGAIMGSVLYHIRVLFRYYVKSGFYSYRWFAKYVSAPWESAAMSLVVFALVRGGLALLGGPPAESAGSTSYFSSFGIGALVGFGMRDVVGWLENLVRTMFVAQDLPHQQKKGRKPE